MSGLEVVGVVLGSLPLAIEGLKYYRDGMETIHDMFKYRDAFNMIYVEFSKDLSCYAQECENLYLKELQMPDHEYEEIVKARGRNWDQDIHKGTEQKLRDKLGNDLDMYLTWSTQLNKRLDLLRRKLGLNEDFSVPFMVEKQGRKVVDETKCAEFFTLSSRVKGALRKGQLKTLTEEIGRDVERLGRFTTKAIKLSQSHHRRRGHDRPVNNSEYWLSMRPHTLHLHEALYRKWSQSCDPSHRHGAQLRLDLPRKHVRVEDAPKFQFSFTLEGDSHAPVTLPWTWRDVRLISLPQTDSSTLASKVQFTLPSVQVHAPQHVSKCSCPCSQEVDNICKAMGGPCLKSNCMGSFVHRQRCYHIHDETSSGPRQLICLQELFGRKSRKGLRRNERTSIAFALASAVLQLYDTPWLGTTWALDDLYLRPSGTSYDLVVQEEFGCTPCSQHQTQNAKPNIDSLIKNTTIYSLGIALLELANGQSLPDCQTDQDLGADGRTDALTPYRTVNRLLQELYEDEKESNFVLAVDCCINPRPPSNGLYSGDFSLTNDKFRERFFEDVVVRLQEDYDAVYATQ